MFGPAYWPAKIIMCGDMKRFRSLYLSTGHVFRRRIDVIILRQPEGCGVAGR
jgi:hypothetical protein